MKLELLYSDKAKLNKALKLVESTENFYSFDKTTVIKTIIESIYTIEDKITRQESFLKSI